MGHFSASSKIYPRRVTDFCFPASQREAEKQSELSACSVSVVNMNPQPPLFLEVVVDSCANPKGKNTAMST